MDFLHVLPTSQDYRAIVLAMLEEPALLVNGARLRVMKAGLWQLWPVYRLQRAAFGVDAWPLIDIFGLLAMSPGTRLGAWFGETFVGFGALVLRERQGVAWLATLAVDEAWQRRGVGTALLQAAEAASPFGIIRLTVREDNTTARRLYERHGYVEVRRRPQYYYSGATGIEMEKQL